MPSMSNRFVTFRRLATIGLAAIPALLTGACASERDRYPSLAIRPAERALGQVQAAPAVPAPAPADATLPQRLAALEARAREADGRFGALVPEATRAAERARGSATGSEAWNLAQITLARLESARGETAVVLADLDQMASEAEIAAVDRPDPDSARVLNARDAVAARVAQQDTVLAQLKS